jgi:acetoin utilization protein AcuC
MTDGKPARYRPWEEGFDPDLWLDHAVHETRMAAFPLHGLDPLP